MKRFLIGFSVFLLVFGLALPLQAQHRYLGEGGARVLQCARFYSSVQAQLLCVRGDELSAGQIERLDLVDRNERIGQYGGYSGYDGGDGYFYRTDSAGRSAGTRERIVTGSAIGAGAGYAIFGNTRGAAGGVVVGAVIGAISGSKANKRAKQEAEIHETQFRAETQAQEQARVAVQRQTAEEARQVPLIIRNTTSFTARLYQNDHQVRDLRPGQSYSGPEGEYRAELRVPARGGYVELVEADLQPHERGWDIVPPRF